MKQRSILLWNNRMMEQRMAAGEEIYQTAVLWRAMAQGMAGSPRKEEKLSARIWPELRGLGMELGSLRITQRGEDGAEVFLVLRARKKMPGLCEDDRRASFRLHGGKNASSLELYGSSG